MKECPWENKDPLNHGIEVVEKQNDMGDVFYAVECMCGACGPWSWTKADAEKAWDTRAGA